VAAISVIPLAIGQAINLASAAGLTDESEPGAIGALSGLGAQFIGSLISFVMAFIATTVLAGVLTRVLGRAVFGGRITAGEAWSLVRSRALALLGLALLQGLILAAPLIVIAVVVAALVTSGTFADYYNDIVLNGGDAVPSIGLGLLFIGVLFLLYVPYLLFFQTKFALSAPALVLEGRGVTDAMRRSWRLVKGDSWRVLGILLVTGILTTVLSWVLSIPFNLGGSVLTFLGGGTRVSVVLATIVITLGNVLGSMITYPLKAGVSGLLYADRRMRAEAFDLVLQTAAARNQTQGWVHATVDDLWHPSYAAGPGNAPRGSSPYGPYGSPPYGPQP
jgi:hypothetical protein